MVQLNIFHTSTIAKRLVYSVYIVSIFRFKNFRIHTVLTSLISVKSDIEWKRLFSPCCIFCHLLSLRIFFYFEKFSVAPTFKLKLLLLDIYHIYQMDRTIDKWIIYRNIWLTQVENGRQKLKNSANLTVSL